MTDQAATQFCPQDVIDQLVGAISADAAAGLARLEAAVLEYPADPRLHFLQGSLLAGAQRYGEAHTAMARAVELAPDYPIARYQLGFLQFTSGDTISAAITWAPLQQLGVNAPLALFAQGLQLLTQDRFQEAIPILEEGMARNTELPPVNHDIRLIVEGLRALQAGGGAATDESGEPTSAAAFLLGQFGSRDTKH